MWPALAWKTNSATADAITAPARANAAAASGNGRNDTNCAISRGSS